MNLGVLLYTLKTHDIGRYKKWLNWLDNFSTTTKLCKKKGDEIDFSDCIKVEWPRVCPEDLGYSKDPGTAIFGRYGGQCVLRPPDALDFAAVNDALGVAPPGRMSNWEVNSRAMMRGAKEIAAAVVPVTRGIEGPPLVFMSLVERDNFPLHLDAIRVLIRMMIRNPSLRLNNLPDLPNPNDDLPGVLDAAALGGTDPASINMAANIIAARNSNNPFYRLLAGGPTPDVRDLILTRCPAVGEHPEGDDWIWEKHPGEEHASKQHSMGWDCVFVGVLYNKMRVKKPIVEELLDLFLKFVDPMDNSLKQTSQALQVAEAANALQQKALDEAERELSSANDFVNQGYAQARKAAVDAEETARKDLERLGGKVADLETKIKDKETEYTEGLKLPDKIPQQVTKTLKEGCNYVRDWLGDWTEQGCKFVTRTTTELVDNTDKVNQLNSLRSAVDSLKAIASAQTALDRATKRIVDLDEELQSTREKLQKRTLQAGVEIERKKLQLETKGLGEARKVAAEARRADARVRGFLAVWRNDRPSIESLAVPADIPPNDQAAEPTKSEKESAGESSDKASTNSRGSSVGTAAKHNRNSGSTKNQRRNVKDITRSPRSAKHAPTIAEAASQAWAQFKSDLHHAVVSVRRGIRKVMDGARH